MRPTHGGNIDLLRRTVNRPVVDFSANINPVGPPAWYRQLISRNLENTRNYPDPDCTEFRAAAAALHQVDADQIVPANGVSELIYSLPRACGPKFAVLPIPSYLDYQHACECAGVHVERILTNSDDQFDLDLNKLQTILSGDAGRGAMAWIGQPNNPTGRSVQIWKINELCTACPDTVFVIDESFADYIEGYKSITSLGLKNVVVLRSLTKFYGVPGLRVGYAVTEPRLAKTIAEQIPTWSVNSLAQAFAAKALTDLDFASETRRENTESRKKLFEGLKALPRLKALKGEANFLLLRIDESRAGGFATEMLDAGLAVRECSDFPGLGGGYYRVAVRSDQENEVFLDAAKRILVPTTPRRVAKRQTSRLMLQGTASNAGKSVLTAAVCRILLQDGYRVAPFKAQNMSLNSYVTAGGGEMGRAQVVQAQACRVEPDVRMNPVLLKPSSQTGSQVILCGKPVAFMEAKKYHTDKTRLFEEVCRCYDELASENDVVVLEGAGSPGEVNLKKYDIVNMRMAEYAHAPVLLVGDIDRGGVFASFIGTMEVLEDWERKLIRGFLINKFRGDASLLDSALSYTFDHTGKPTVGIIPMIHDLGIPEEDSVSFKEVTVTHHPDTAEGKVVVGLVDLPHISNFTDLDPLRNEPDVEVEIIRRPSDLDRCDAIVIPGSKNVSNDLRYLKESGIAAGLGAAARRKNIIGICGGYQMLGKAISDPAMVETTDGTQHGLGLLAVDTVMGREKILNQARATHAGSGGENHELYGYEIHHGRSTATGLVPWIRRDDGEVIGYTHPDLDISGTYLHGLFDADMYRRWFVDRLRQTKGLTPLGKVVYVNDIEPALDRLADTVRENIDMEALYRMLEEPS